jgi:ABC-2 type transport system ATP-binding protein
MIEVENLTKYYGMFPGILGVSFSIKKGEIVGFLGPNGAGKTTTMRILSGFFPPSRGKATVAGFDVFKDSLKVRERIGYLPESNPIYTDMLVTEYLNFVAEVKGVSRSERKDKIAKVIEDCGLSEMENRMIGKLSKGFRQRVGLAQALLNDPEVLILDEPTLGLDPKQITEIRSLIKRLSGERTIILSTHILPEVSMICERVIIINEGRIVAEDTPQNLDAQLQKAARISVQVDGPSTKVQEALEKVKGVTKVVQQEKIAQEVFSYIIETDKNIDIRRQLAKEVCEKGWGLLELKSLRMSLEDIFIKLVTEEGGEEV